MGLVRHAIEGEADQTGDPNDKTVELIREAMFAQRAVRGLVEPDEQAVTQMADHQYERDREPPPPLEYAEREKRLGQIETTGDDREGGSAHPRCVVAGGCCGGCVHSLAGKTAPFLFLYAQGADL